jgi:hypothetical protein
VSRRLLFHLHDAPAALIEHEGWHCDLNHITSSSIHGSIRCEPAPPPPEAAPHVADAVTDPRHSPPVVPRQKLPELYALASVREEAFANGTTPPPGFTLADRDVHRGQAAGFEAASMALQSHRRLTDAVDMLRRLMNRLELRGEETIYPAGWREGYLRAVDDAVQTIERTLAAEQFDAARDRRLERRVMRIEMRR